jgi:hypothetical protein
VTREHSDLGENAEMKKWIVTSLLAIGLAPAALAAEKFFVIVDTVGNCFVVQSTPNTALSLVPAPVRCPGSPGHLSLGE